MKPNLKDVKLPKTWGKVRATMTAIPSIGWHCVKFPPTIEVKEVSRIITNVRKRWKRMAVKDQCLQGDLHNLFNDLRQALQLRSRSRK
jgi:hypothetical protein